MFATACTSLAPSPLGLMSVRRELEAKKPGKFKHKEVNRRILDMLSSDTVVTCGYLG